MPSLRQVPKSRLWVGAAALVVAGIGLTSYAFETTDPDGGSVALKIIPTLKLPPPTDDYDRDGVPPTSDCDNADPLVWRFVVTYVDVDGDGVGSGSGTVTCMGATAPSGRSMLGYDPLDTLGDPESANVSDFDLPASMLTAIDSDGKSSITR